MKRLIMKSAENLAFRSEVLFNRPSFKVFTAMKIQAKVF
jgi:hypothetical protein